MSSRDPAKLTPAFRTKLFAAMEEAKKLGVEMVIYETERDVWEQARNYRQSSTGAEVRAAIADLKAKGATFLAKVLEDVGPQPDGPWLTNALPGYSFHQWGSAADLYWKKNGKAEWADMSGYKTFAECCKRQGLNHGYFWGSRDAVHVQLSAQNKPEAPAVDIDRAMRSIFAKPNA